MPDSLGFSSRQRPEHPRPASTRLPNNRQHAARAAPSLHPTRFLPNKSPPSIPHPHSQAALFPTPRPGPPAIRSQQSVPSGNSRQLPAHAFTSRARNTHKLPQAPLPPSERPAILQTRPLLSPPNARPHRRSDTPAPRNPEHRPASRNPQIPPGIPTPRFPAPASRNTKKTKPALRRLRSKLFTGIYSIVPISV